ncbi:hypothetical protein AB0I53_22045 [Saccharopolyspora sp. NPDC050389]|uniref:hypothetical protein n=1 Tax=Saccharopolyspora sp. NPDC050389 TaxID=3155516 RepID=UPI0033D8CF76
MFIDHVPFPSVVAFASDQAALFEPADGLGDGRGADLEPARRRDPNIGVDDRRIVLVPGRTWRYEQERCPLGGWDPVQDTFGTELLDDRVLVCSGCGLDVS